MKNVFTRGGLQQCLPDHFSVTVATADDDVDGFLRVKIFYLAVRLSRHRVGQILTRDRSVRCAPETATKCDRIKTWVSLRHLEDLVITLFEGLGLADFATKKGF